MEYDAAHGGNSGHHRHIIAYRGRRSLIQPFAGERVRSTKLILSDLQGVGPIVCATTECPCHLPAPTPAKSCVRNFLHRGEWMTARSLTLLISP
jgi:hypothetical protein